jgi:ABC-2 type transport system ATP-binding protein
MSFAALRERLGTRRLVAVLVVVALLLVGALTALALGGGSGYRVTSRFIAGTPEPDGTAVHLDTSLYLPDSTPAPAVLLSQGFGGGKQDLASTAELFAQHGYVALTYSARGFAKSTGKIHFASPGYEVKDGSKLLDSLAASKFVKRVGGRPQLAVAGASYGGGLSLLIAAADHRVGAVAADITWNDLSHALFPNAVGSGPGVFKKLWAGQLFGNAFPDQRLTASNAADVLGRAAADPASVTCGNFAADVCAAYQASAAAGTPNAAMARLMQQASPASVLGRIVAPTLLTQGEHDSLFPLSEADANARGIAAHGTPVRVVWRAGGHDAGGTAINEVTNAALSWFGTVFGGTAPKQQPFTLSEQAGVISAATGDVSEQTLRSAGYPGVAGTARQTRTEQLLGPAQTISSPGGGSPTVITSIPGLGGISSRFDQALTLLPSAPGQTAIFASPKLPSSLLIAGSPSVRLSVTAKSSSDVTLFAGLRDVAPDGTTTLPSQLVSPLRLTGMQPGVGRVVTVRLPSVVRNVRTGDRLVLSVSSTDFAYAVPQDARTYTVALAGSGVPAEAAGLGVSGAGVAVPTISGTAIGGGHPFAWVIVGLVVAALVLAVVAFAIIRRRRVLEQRPDLRDVPVVIDSLVKEYKGGYRAVDGVSFRVERGQVVGLLGPNGAGKTTVLRVLVGLIRPTSGTLHVFGEPIVAGAPVLSRLGAFIEGPGFLPHLTGRENLRLFWAATGRPHDEADFDTALEIAGLGGSIDRRVRAYSQGMRQRLGIAQAMLGLPELLVLDEPTNGLDPPQIAEMREVLQRYAETGRTVVVSSHLLAEVEQTCTHVVVMHHGKLVAAGSVADIAGAGGVQLAVSDPDGASRVLAAAGIGAQQVPARRALEDVFLGLIGGDE